MIYLSHNSPTNQSSNHSIILYQYYSTTLIPLNMKIVFFLFVIPFVCLCSSRQSFSQSHDNTTDLAALLSFKSHVYDPTGILDSSWLTNTSFCKWVGVLCSARQQRVVALSLAGSSLSGTISPMLGNLSFIQNLDLRNNSLTGSIPESLGNLRRLTNLTLNKNMLTGNVPSSIFDISLEYFSVAYNNLSGPLTASNRSIFTPRLRVFTVEGNHFTGFIPLGIGRCINLEFFSISTNQFTGSIPLELHDLPKLKVLYLDTNNLTGHIPPSLGNLTGLTNLDLSTNQFSGQVPGGLGNLKNLQTLSLAQNALTGSILFLSNFSSLAQVDLSLNKFTGTIPDSIGKDLPNLNQLFLKFNHLSGTLNFIDSLSNCKNLQTLSLSFNNLKGPIPVSIGNLSNTFQKFSAETNLLSGAIPLEISNITNLLALDLYGNKLTGNIPSSIGEMKQLQELYLGKNALSGTIPSEIGQIKSLVQVIFEFNSLTGAIPYSIGNLTNLLYLRFAYNNLSSTIPRGVWNLNNLLQLSLSFNLLEGSISSDVGSIKSLDILDLANNRLSGRIPDLLGQLKLLEYMDLSYNSFVGPIPVSLGTIANINYMNLSCNNLSGTIPKSLANLKYLVELNLSYNNLEGEIPAGGVFSNITLQYLVGNRGLCGAPSLGLARCDVEVTKSNAHLLKVIIPVIASGLIFTIFCIVFMYWWRTKHTLPMTTTPSMKEYNAISYYELVRATQNFSASNLLGTGGFSSVYKGKLDNGTFVAVKILKLHSREALKTFDSECAVLGMIRHRNLVKVISTCSNLDFKAIVLQFMPNGNLDQWIHSPTNCLNLAQRLNVAFDVALGLEYLHHHHHDVVLHCDIKPSNVLLDEEMNAHLSDFGISKILQHDTGTLTSTGALGTIGYMPPEYATASRVSREGDVYSYGMLLLEILTGKIPTDVMFEGEFNLRQWVHDAYPSSLVNVLDKHLIGVNKIDNGDKFELSSCLHQVVKIALECTVVAPKERVSMQDVVPRLKKIIDEHISYL